MSFASPGWLILLLLLPLIFLGGVLAHKKRNQAWKQFVAPRLQSKLVHPSSLTRRWISFGLALVGAALLIIVIARPFVGEITTTERIRTRNILIAIDTSRSMLVEDGSPTRMASAQAMAIEILDSFPNDRVGIIAFAGVPILTVPLTIDHDAVHEAIGQLDTDLIPTGGSDLNAAVELALKTFEKTGQKSNALVIISDGENHSQALRETCEKIRQSGLTVCTISVGTETGGIIPDPSEHDHKFRDYRGNTVLSRMIPEALDSLARAGRGVYLPARAGASTVIRGTLASVKQQEQRGRKRIIPHERYQWFLLPAILCLALSLIIRSHLFQKKKDLPTPPSSKQAKESSQSPQNNKTSIPDKKSHASRLSLLIVLFLIFSPSLLHADALDRAKKAYKSHDYQEAITLFEVALHRAPKKHKHSIAFALGSSHYRLKHWEKAISYFSVALVSKNKKLQENSHYNLAQSLFRYGLKILKHDRESETNFLTLFQDLFGHSLGQSTIEISDANLKLVTTAWKDAIDHYQSAIELNHHNQRAIENKKMVQRLLDELLQSQAEKKEREKQKKKPEDQYNPERDPNNDPNQQEGENSKSKGEGDDPNKTSGKEEKDPKSDKNPQKDQNNKDQNKDQNKDSQKDSQSSSNDSSKKSETPNKGGGKNQPDKKQKDGESDEAYAARILKDYSDAETRHVKRRVIQFRRHANDW